MLLPSYTNWLIVIPLKPIACKIYPENAHRFCAMYSLVQSHGIVHIIFNNVHSIIKAFYNCLD